MCKPIKSNVKTKTYSKKYDTLNLSWWFIRVCSTSTTKKYLNAKRQTPEERCLFCSRIHISNLELAFKILTITNPVNELCL